MLLHQRGPTRGSRIASRTAQPHLRRRICAAAPAAHPPGSAIPNGPLFTGMRAIFLGTISSIPTKTRNVSSLVVHLATGDQWMFDCGEATQHRIRNGDHAGFKNINRIFVTHMHADHVMGLPTLILSIIAARKSHATFAPPPVEIYGPRGLRLWLRSTFSLTRSRRASPSELLVHELSTNGFDVPVNKVKSDSKASVELDKGKISGERNISVDPEEGTQLFDTADYIVSAAPIKHTVPCYGYVLREKTKLGRLDAAGLEAEGVPPGPIYKAIKASAGPFTLPDGKVIDTSKYIGKPYPGRSMAILGDTHDPSPLGKLAQGVDLLIHEATLAEVDKPIAAIRGHSTASMAGEFAARIQAKNLVLNHFGATIDNESSEEYSFSRVAACAGATFSGPIFAANDNSWFDLVSHGKAAESTVSNEGN